MFRTVVTQAREHPGHGTPALNNPAILVVSCAEPNGPVPKPLCPAERLICKFTSTAVEGHTFDTNSGARWI